MILSKSQLVSNINNEISDQSNGQISPHDIRHNLLDIIDSVHNLTLSQDLTSLNLATFPSGNTRVGQLTLENIGLDGYFSQDNTAVGYSSLKSSYKSSKNTSIGSYALSCNVYGQENVALGYSSLGGNTIGHLNVGLGNYALNNNKSGNGNIAIGHGAGYYVDKNTSHKLFVAYHPVNGEYICNNPLGTGFMPLIYGDLSGIMLGVGVRSLHSYGTLQVGGSISPSGNDVVNLGHPSYNWKNLYLSSSLTFSNSTSINSSTNSVISVQGTVRPSTNNLYDMGTLTHKWAKGHFQNLKVDGTAEIYELITTSEQNYSGIKLYLGTDNNLNAVYNDSDLLGGGVIIKSSGGREYSMSYYPPASGMPCFVGEYNKSAFRSNISFQVPSSAYIKTNNIVSYEEDAFNDGDCYGLFFNSGITYISRKNVLNVNPGSSSGHLAGIGNLNFLSNSGELNDYVLSVSSIESGVSVSQRFLTGTKVRQKDALNNNKDKLSGFEIKYIDDSSLDIQGPLTDRLVVGSYDRTSKFVNGFVVMKNDDAGSVFGITNMPSVTENILPKTILNVRSQNHCIGRFTAESNGFYKSAIQLLVRDNCEASGVEFAYLNNSGIADITMYKNSSATNFFRMKDINEIGILSSGVTNSTITIGHSGMHQLPVISLKDNTFVTNSGLVASSGYGKIYNLRDARSYANQFNSLFYSDASGNQFNLVVNKLDNVDARAVYTDTSGNTFAGYLSPSGRKTITGSTRNNISYGYQALYSILSGSGNLAVGYDSLYNLASGNNNIVIGESSASGLSNTSNNIIIGNRSFNKTSDLASTSGNIIIGHNIGASNSGSHNFLIGNNGLILLDGKLGPTNADKRLTLPSGGRLYINNVNDTESLCLKTNVIEVIDSGGSNYPENSLTFKFSANNSADLMILNHNSDNANTYASVWGGPTVIVGGSYVDNYWFPDTGLLGDVDAKPYAQLNGNLKLKGNIQFSDGTYLGSTKPIKTNTSLANSGIALGNSGIAIGNSGIALVHSSTIEGFMPNGLQAPASFGLKTSGLLIIKDSNWADSGSVFVINRDATSVIHSGAYVIASRINNEYKPTWISAADTSCLCCNNGIFITPVGGGGVNPVSRGTFLLTSPSGTFNVPGGYAVGSLDVFMNGIKLSASGDYVANNGVSFTLTELAPSGSIIEHLSLGPSAGVNN